MRRIIPFLGLLVFSGASAVVISNPTLSTVIDPPGAEDVDFIASNATAESTLEAVPGLLVLSQADGIDSNTPSNIFSFSNPDLPDIRLTLAGAISSSDNIGSLDNPAFETSDTGSAFGWYGTNGQTVTIEFGTWDGAVFTPGAGVKAAGLTFANFGGAYDTTNDQTVTYHDAADNLLSTQVFAGGADPAGTGGGEAYSGYLSASYNISKIVISITRSSGNSQIGIDDIAFTETTPPASSLQFTSSAFAIPLDASSVAISVERTGSTEGGVSVSYATSDKSALDGVDYTAASGSLDWADGESGVQTFQVVLLNNPDSAGTEFSVSLSAPTGGAILGSPSVADVSLTAPVGETYGTDLVAYLSMDEATAPSDHSEYRLGATTEGTASTATAVYGNARDFDGTNDRIRLDPWTGETSLADRESLTVSLWFKADTTAGQLVLFDDPVKHDALGARINNSTLEVTCQRNGKKVTLSTAFTDISSWHNLAVVKGGAAMAVFLDGAPVANVGDLDTAPASSIDAGSGSPFPGIIDEVRLYRRALSITEIGALQAAPPLSAGEVWRGFYFAQTSNAGGAADDVDYDMDGVANLLERASLTNPTDPGSRYQPSLSILEETGMKYLGLTYRRIAGGTGSTGVDYAAEGLSYTVDYNSGLLGPWESGSVVPVDTAVPFGTRGETVTVRLPVPLSSGENQFARLRIETTP
jgi:hypothetical protein